MTASEQKVVVYGGKTYAEAPASQQYGAWCAGCAFDNAGCSAPLGFQIQVADVFGDYCDRREVIYVEASS